MDLYRDERLPCDRFHEVWPKLANYSLYGKREDLIPICCPDIDSGEIEFCPIFQ